MIVDCLICCTVIYQCLGLVLWNTEVLTEGLPLPFGIPFSIVIFSIVIFIMWTFSANKHMNGWMDGWMDGWMEYLYRIFYRIKVGLFWRPITDAPLIHCPITQRSAVPLRKLPCAVIRADK